MVISATQERKQNHSWSHLALQKTISDPSSSIVDSVSLVSLKTIFFLSALLLFQAFYHFSQPFLLSFATFRLSIILKNDGKDLILLAVVVGVSSEEEIVIMGICLDISTWGWLKHLRTEMSTGIRRQSRGHTGQIEGESFLAPGDTLNSVKITVVQWG